MEVVFKIFKIVKKMGLEKKYGLEDLLSRPKNNTKHVMFISSYLGNLPVRSSSRFSIF